MFECHLKPELQLQEYFIEIAIFKMQGAFIFPFLSLTSNGCNIETMNWGLSILIGFVFLIMLVLQTRANIHIIQLKQAAKCNHTSHIQSYKRKK